MKYKIKSVSDVITNSSTEVFLLETTKSLGEVSEILSGLTSGYFPPVILGLGDPGNPLRQVYDFEYLYSEGSKEDRYIYSLDQLTQEIRESWLYKALDIQEPSEELKKLILAFRGYYESREKEILSSLDKLDPYQIPLEEDTFRLNTIGWYLRSGKERGLDFPWWILDDFLRGSIPECLYIPPQETTEYWEGKIGFSGKDDNSIPLEDFKKILETFGGINYHLG